MSAVEPAKAAVRIPFVCPICAGANAVELLLLSRAGGVECVECSKWLRAADVMRAIHAPRSANAGHDRRVRAPPPKRAPMVWPPTAASRAAVAPLHPPRGGGN